MPRNRLAGDPSKGLRSLQKTIGLDVPIRCIEGIDIAHLAGNETVGSKVCFIDGRPFKDAYRRYRVRTVGNDDYEAIREVVSRRYRDAGEGNELYPDVILIDVNLDVEVDGPAPSVDLNGFREAVRSVGQRISAGTLVVVETTVPPGTCEHVVAPALREALRKRGLAEDAFLLAHSYERVMPGREYLAGLLGVHGRGRRCL